MCLPRCGNSGRSDVLKLLFPGLLGVSPVALQRPDGDGVNVSIESNQITLIPVKRGPKGRRTSTLFGRLYLDLRCWSQNYRCEREDWSPRPAGCVVGSEGLLVTAGIFPKRSGFPGT